MSIILYYRQLSPQKWWRWSVHATGFVVGSYCIALFFAVIFACNPIRKSWDVTVTGGSCIDVLSMFKATASLGIVTDLVMLGLPFPLILQLNMKIPQKLGVIFVFIIGSALATRAPFHKNRNNANLVQHFRYVYRSTGSIIFSIV